MSRKHSSKFDAFALGLHYLCPKTAKIGCTSAKHPNTFDAFALGLHYLCLPKRRAMGYDIKDKMEWTVIFILEFGRRHGLTMRQSFRYLSRYKGIEYVDKFYGYVHTQSFASMVEDLTEYCHRKGGQLV